jgi:hypothetical protein
VAYQDYLTYLGHATVLVEVDGVRVMTDPVLRPGAAMLHRMPKAADLREYTEVDLVVISHLHHDHLDLPSLRLLRDDPLIVVPYGAERWGPEMVVDKLGEEWRGLRVKVKLRGQDQYNFPIYAIIPISTPLTSFAGGASRGRFRSGARRGPAAGATQPWCRRRFWSQPGASPVRGPSRKMPPMERRKARRLARDAPRCRGPRRRAGNVNATGLPAPTGAPFPRSAGALRGGPSGTFGCRERPGARACQPQNPQTNCHSPFPVKQPAP